MILTLGPTPTLQRTMTFARLDWDGVNRAVHVQEYAAGKAINVARVLRTLGRDVTALGFLGGATGAACRADLARIGIGDQLLEVDAPTRLCITAVDQAAGQATELIEESAPVPSADYQRLLAELERHLHGARALVISGTLTPGADPAFYGQCVQRAGRAGVVTIVDARGEALRRALKHRPTVVKPNLGELAATLDVPVDALSDSNTLRGAMKRLIEQGAQGALVSRGHEPALLTDGTTFWQITPPRVKVVSPIGSGDSLAAGLAAGLIEGQALPQASCRGVACGTANALTSRSGHLEPSDVQSLLEKTRLQPWA